LPELALAEENQQVAMTLDDSLSPSLFTFRSHFPSIHHNWYYIFMTVEVAAKARAVRRFPNFERRFGITSVKPTTLPETTVKKHVFRFSRRSEE